MTFPSASKPVLIEMPSFARSPTALVRFSYNKNKDFVNDVSV
jgi:hypothetical protein